MAFLALLLLHGWTEFFCRTLYSLLFVRWRIFSFFFFFLSSSGECDYTWTTVGCFVFGGVTVFPNLLGAVILNTMFLKLWAVPILSSSSPPNQCSDTWIFGGCFPFVAKLVYVGVIRSLLLLSFLFWVVSSSWCCWLGLLKKTCSAAVPESCTPCCSLLSGRWRSSSPPNALTSESLYGASFVFSKQ